MVLVDININSASAQMKKIIFICQKLWGGDKHKSSLSDILHNWQQEIIAIIFP